MPEAIDEQSPNVRTRKLPSLGRSAFHSSVIAPAELTTSASLDNAATSLRQSNLFIACHFSLFLKRLKHRAPPEHLFGQQQRHRPLGVFS